MNRYVHVHVSHEYKPSCTGTIMERYRTVCSWTDTGTFMDSYPHIQVHSWTGTFMDGYIHGQIRSCTVQNSIPRNESKFRGISQSSAVFSSQSYRGITWIFGGIRSIPQKFRIPRNTFMGSIKHPTSQTTSIYHTFFIIMFPLKMFDVLIVNLKVNMILFHTSESIWKRIWSYCILQNQFNLLYHVRSIERYFTVFEKERIRSQIPKITISDLDSRS
jgi:hypothetical protein